MKKADIAVGGFYAYERNRYGATKAVVVDTGNYGRLAKHHSTLNRSAYAAVCERAGLNTATHFHVADENATVAIQTVNRDGALSDMVTFTSARFIKSTWLEHEVAQAEARAAAERRSTEREAYVKKNVEDGREFHLEVLRFAEAAEKARVVFEVKDRGFDAYNCVDAIGIAEVSNSNRHGVGNARSVTLNRQAVNRLTALLESLDVDPETLWTVEEVAS